MGARADREPCDEDDLSRARARRRSQRPHAPLRSGARAGRPRSARPLGPLGGTALARPLHLHRFVPNLLCMSKTRTEVLTESRKKGLVAGATTAGAVAAG